MAFLCMPKDACTTCFTSRPAWEFTFEVLMLKAFRSNILHGFQCRFLKTAVVYIQTGMVNLIEFISLW